MADGRKRLQELHRDCSSLLRKELLSVPSVVQRVRGIVSDGFWLGQSRPLTHVCERQFTVELALLTSSSGQFLSRAVKPLPNRWCCRVTQTPPQSKKTDSTVAPFLCHINTYLPWLIFEIFWPGKATFKKLLTILIYPVGVNGCLFSFNRGVI